MARLMRAGDFLVMTAAMALLQMWALASASGAAAESPCPFWLLAGAGAIMPAVAFVTLREVLGLYDLADPLRGLRRVLRLLMVAAILVCLLKAADVLVCNNALGWLVLLCVAAVVMTTGPLVRGAVEILMSWRPKGPDQSWNVLVVDSNERIRHLVLSVNGAKNPFANILGFADERRRADSALPGIQLRQVADLDEIDDFLRENCVDEVVLSLPLRSMQERVEGILSNCMEQGIRVSLLDDLPDEGTVRGQYCPYPPPTNPIYSGTGHFGQTLGKRVMDLALCIPLLVLAAPVALLCAVLIKATSPGPVVFVQDRVGLNKRLFRFYKFRTMVQEAPALQAGLEDRNEVAGCAFKIRNDPRVTPVGRFLRKFSLDELPQLINVLHGEMSLVGPRPLVLRDTERMETDWIRRRFSVVPGLTCLWQISGRLDVPFEEWMRMDLEYIDNWSLMLDLKILLKTIPAVLSGRGAY